MAHAQELGGILTSEQGKPLGDAVGEAFGFGVFTKHFAAMDLPIEIIEDSEKRRVESHRMPLGVVGAIIPWNFPLVLLGFKLAPALLTGAIASLRPDRLR